MRYRKCRYCGEKTVPYGSLQPFCFKSECIKAHNEAVRKKKKERERKKLREEDIKYWKKKAKELCHLYIRERDRLEPCISCGYSGNERQWHAGHFRPSGVNAALRYDEMNIHKQCSICNNHKSGNLIEYEKNLRLKIGDKEVDRLLTTKTVKKWTIEDLKEVVEYYKNKIKRH